MAESDLRSGFAYHIGPILRDSGVEVLRSASPASEKLRQKQQEKTSTPFVAFRSNSRTTKPFVPEKTMGLSELN